MTDEEILQKLSKLEKKLDKLLNLTTKLAKTLHLVPVTEAEERQIQLAQRNNLALASKVNTELNIMENKLDEGEGQLTLSTILEKAAYEDNVYDGIIDSDYLGGS